jgi:hypothetical protein
VEKLCCRQCGTKVKQPRSGRPREYCSITCRRALEIRRRVWDVELARRERETIDHGEITTGEMRAAARRRRDEFLRDCPRP